MRSPLVVGLTAGFAGVIAGWGIFVLTDSDYSSAIRLSAPTPSDPRCPALLAALPTDLSSSLTARTTEPISSSTRAWGSPPVTLVCGGTRPPRVLDTDGLSIDEVEWSSPKEGDNPTIYRSKDPAAPYLVVTMPNTVTPVTILGPLVDAIKAQVKPSPQ